MSVPTALATPRLNCPPGSICKVPVPVTAALAVMVPAVSSVPVLATAPAKVIALPVPDVTVPELANAPAVVKVRPPRMLNEPRLLLSELMRANTEPAPLSVTLPWLVKMLEPFTKVSVALLAIQVPPVSVVPDC